MKISPKLEVRKSLDIIFSGKKNVHKYDVISTLEEKTRELRCAIEQVSQTDYGKLFEVCYEDIITVKSSSEEHFEPQPTRIPVVFGPFYLIYFEEKPLGEYIGILAGGDIARKISTILNKLVSTGIGKTTTSLHGVKFLVREKQEDIRRIPDFQDVTEVYVESIPDAYVDALWMRGTMLDQTDEYQKFIEDLGGRLTILAVRFRDRIYYIYEDGRIFTKQAADRSLPKIANEIQYFYEIASRLHGVGAIK